jgi:hypothetical protein
MSELRLSQGASYSGVLLVPHKDVKIDAQGLSTLETPTGSERIPAGGMNLTAFGEEGRKNHHGYEKDSDYKGASGVCSSLA